MKFIEYIEARIKDEQYFDVIIGGAYMPVTLEFCDDWVITDYCKEKYGELLNSEVKFYPEESVVDVLYDNAKIGKQFCMAVAGYVAVDEWDRLFSNNK